MRASREEQHGCARTAAVARTLSSRRLDARRALLPSLAQHWLRRRLGEVWLVVPGKGGAGLFECQLLVAGCKLRQPPDVHPRAFTCSAERVATFARRAAAPTARAPEHGGTRCTRRSRTCPLLARGPLRVPPRTRPSPMMVRERPRACESGRVRPSTSNSRSASEHSAVSVTASHPRPPIPLPTLAHAPPMCQQGGTFFFLHPRLTHGPLGYGAM